MDSSNAEPSRATYSANLSIIGLTSGGGGMTLPDEDDDSDRGLEYICEWIQLFSSEKKTYEDSSFLISSDFVDILSSSFSFITLNHSKGTSFYRFRFIPHTCHVA